jgi:hypothetical protein
LLEEHLKYFPENHLHIYKKLAGGTTAGDQNDLKELMDAISLKFSFENQDFETDDLKKEMQNLMRALKVEYLKEKRQEISELIKRMEREGDESRLQEALQEFDIISKELQNI